MFKKITDIFSTGGTTPEDKKLNKLNFILYMLITCIGVYGLLMVYSVQVKTEAIIQSQESLRSVVMLPSKYQIGGHTNETNIALVTTNFTKEPTKVKIDEKTFYAKKEYSRGDVVLIKYFNIYGVIADRSETLKDYYKVLYRDNNHRLDNFELPAEFLLSPSANALNPYIFTP